MNASKRGIHTWIASYRKLVVGASRGGGRISGEDFSSLRNTANQPHLWRFLDLRPSPRASRQTRSRWACGACSRVRSSEGGSRQRRVCRSPKAPAVAFSTGLLWPSLALFGFFGLFFLSLFFLFSFFLSFFLSLFVCLSVCSVLFSGG